MKSMTEGNVVRALINDITLIPSSILIFESTFCSTDTDLQWLKDRYM
jgi:hypothetical protein